MHSQIHRPALPLTTSVSCRVSLLKEKNSLKDVTERLEVVPRVNEKGELEEPPLFPPNVASLVVSGSETPPGTHARNSWNSTKSLQLIQFYDPGYHSDTPSGEGHSRRRRLTLARLIGVTRHQLKTALVENAL